MPVLLSLPKLHRISGARPSRERLLPLPAARPLRMASGSGRASPNPSPRSDARAQMKPAPITDGLESSTEAWNCVRAALPKMHGQDAFQNWIEPLVFVGIEHGVLHLTAPTSF